MACAVADCGAPARIRGLCKRHFNSWYKATTRRRVTAIRPRPLTADAILSEDVEPHACTPDCELAWLAGLLEGEGCFSMANAGAHRYPAVRVEMASRDVVERAARLLEAVAKLASDAIANALQHEETQAIALSDLLTGLPNARALRQKFEESATRARRFNLPFSILMMDLDGFKAINDTLGHQTGDRVMKEVAQVLAKQIRASDFLGRYAGDEFVAILHIDQDGARELVRRLQRVVDGHDFGFKQAGMGLGVSIGWASYGVDGETLDELLLAADRAMYSDKLRRKAALADPLPPDDLEPAVSQVM